MEQRDDRLPLPSEDTGDLASEPAEGITDDYLVAQEEGIPYSPPTDRVLSEARADESGADVAGTDPTDAGELAREDNIQPDIPGDLPRDDELAADVVEALRDSDVPAGDRIRVAAEGSRVTLRGEVESVDVLDEILGIAGDVPGVSEVTDEVTVSGL
ncbi:MAG TPA: BON domain-containing protein [Candidatus Limnocylindria bacterium]|nr:BON domain-containing protein [Candidatus Limnocylindria bacterium]